MTEAFDYIETRYDADELIAEFGQVVSIRRSTSSGTAWEPTRATADKDTYGARIEFSYAQKRSGNVLDSDSRWYVSAGPLAVLSVEPAAGDGFVVGGVLIGTILKVAPVSPAGVAVCYDCHVRA